MEMKPYAVVSPDVLVSTAPVSQAIRAGDTIYLAGQVSLDAGGSMVGVGDPRAQTKQILRNIESILKVEGASLRDVVKLTVFVTDMAYLDHVLDVRRRYFPEPPFPAVTLCEISSLVKKEMLVEIEATAVIADTQ